MSDSLSAFVDLEAERALLDSILLVPRQLADVKQLVVADDFHRPWHHQVFEAVLAVAGRGGHVDYVTVHHELRRRGVHADDGAVADLYALRTPDPGSAVEYARIVADLSRRRRLYENLRHAASELVAGAPVDDVVSMLPVSS